MGFNNPFNFDENESSMETNQIKQAANNAVKATQTQVKQHQDATKKEVDSELVDFLYGNTLDESAVDKNADPLTNVVNKTLNQVQATTQAPTPQGAEAGGAGAQMQELAAAGGDENKLAEARSRLAGMHNTQGQGISGLFKQHMPENLKKMDYQEETFGENARRRREQEAKQKQEEEEKEEEEKKKQEQEEKEARDEELADMFAGPKEKSGPGGKAGKKGRNKMQAPIAMKRAQTKAESSRGTVG